MNSLKICFIFLITAFFYAHHAQAHSVKVFAYPEGRVISGYGYFAGAGRTKKAKVVLMGADAREIAETEVNEKGEFQFEIPTYQDYKLRLDAGEGHIAFFKINKQNLDESLFNVTPDPAQTGAATNPPGQPGQIAASATMQNMAQSSGKMTNALTKADIDQIIARHIRPLREQIEASDEKRRFNDILGAIGYIVGIMGLIAFWQARRDKNK